MFLLTHHEKARGADQGAVTAEPRIPHPHPPPLLKPRSAGKGCGTRLAVCSASSLSSGAGGVCEPRDSPRGGIRHRCPDLSEQSPCPPRQPRFLWPPRDPVYVPVAASCVACSFVSEWRWQSRDRFHMETVGETSPDSEFRMARASHGRVRTAGAGGPVRDLPGVHD